MKNAKEKFEKSVAESAKRGEGKERGEKRREEIRSGEIKDWRRVKNPVDEKCRAEYSRKEKS